MTGPVGPREVLDFWFAAGPERWFTKDEDFDAEIARRFGRTLSEARAGRLDRWAETPEGALALVIVLDQFARNIHRGSPRAYSHDDKALALAGEAVRRGWDTQMPAAARKWFYMPYMHAEDLAAQERCIELCRRGGLDEDTLDWAHDHAEIIRRFGRFPHRNAILGRVSTPEELRFLEDGGFAG